MILTHSEQMDLLKRSCVINGITMHEAGRLLKSPTKADDSRLDALARTLSQLKSFQTLKKFEIRLDKGAKAILNGVSSKLTPYEQFIAQTKKPKSTKDCAWIKLVFKKGAATQAEQIALLSQSDVSSLLPVDPFGAQRFQLTSDALTVRSARVFCKRFNLK